MSKTCKPTVEDCIAIDMVLLRKLDLLLEWMTNRINRRWQTWDRIVGDISLTTEFAGGTPYPSLRIEGTCFGRPIDQTIRLVAKSMRFGGKRWYMICPATRRRCCKLILPPGGDLFASVKAWRLPYRSQREDVVTRSHRAIRKLEQRIETLPKFTRTYTRDRLMERKWQREDFLDRVFEHGGKAIIDGRRFSVRNAVRGAQAQTRGRDRTPCTPGGRLVDSGS